MSDKKQAQLGMPIGTATNRLRKNLLFSMAVRLSLNICFRCGKPIERPAELSIEHKQAWLDSHDPVMLFFDLTNIGFSHLKCNIGSARRYRKYSTEEERTLRDRHRNTAQKRRNYSADRRREKYLRSGH